MRKLASIIIALTITTNLWAQFEYCNSNTNKSLNDIYFFDENTGIAVGDSGIVLRSIDGGDNWTIAHTLDSITFTKVKFWNDLNGIAIGTEIYTTHDGGVNWKYQDTHHDGHYSDLELFADNQFLVTHNEAQVNSRSNKVIHFQFRDDRLNILSEKEVDFSIDQMSFVNDSVGFAIHFEGSEVSSILQTIDGGLNWSRLDFETGRDFTILEDIHFISDKIGFKGGWYNPHLMKTIDGGLNWQTVRIKDTRTSIFDLPNLLNFHIDLSTSNHFYSCGWHGELFKSVDLGDTWERLESPVPTGTSITGIYFINDSVGWAVGGNGTIIKTTNGGQLTSTISYSESDTHIYPNPFTTLINIDSHIKEFEKINLFDLTGQLLKSSESNTLSELELFDPGIYILTIERAKSIQAFKMIKN